MLSNSCIIISNSIHKIFNLNTLSNITLGILLLILYYIIKYINFINNILKKFK